MGRGVPGDRRLSSRLGRQPRSDVTVRPFGAPLELTRRTDRAHDHDAGRLDALGILAGERSPAGRAVVACAAAILAVKQSLRPHLNVNPVGSAAPVELAERAVLGRSATRGGRITPTPRQAKSPRETTRSNAGTSTRRRISIRGLARMAKFRIVSAGGAGVRAAGLGTTPLGPDAMQTFAPLRVERISTASPRSDEEGGAARPHSSSPRRGVPRGRVFLLCRARFLAPGLGIGALPASSRFRRAPARFASAEEGSAA
jgi:hypothetical protein